MVLFRFLVAAIVLGASGCRMGAHVAVWQPPQLESTVGKRVAVSTVTGPKEVAGPLREKMLAMAPADSGRNMATVDPEKMASTESIRLVSGTDDVNDIALASVARQENIDYVLRGQVISRTHTPDTEFDPTAPLAISWRLMSIGDNRHVGGRPVVVDLESAKETYPDIAFIADPTEALTTAAVRQSYRLVSPWVDREPVQLAIPYGMPGSKGVRRGNTLASKGRWGEAETVWQETLNKHPTQTAAVHNLAIAAAAGQDFSKAKELARRAIRRQPTGLHKQSLVWIEQKQRLYHKAFNLPEPPEGWFVTHSEDE
ncbi:MAG: tetratricopeptide repeat protein [Rubripirellula sp.]